MTDERDARYPVQAAAKLTGLSTDTLRAWERRYAAVVPKRVGRGRAYSHADLARLRLLRSAVQHGHTIGGIAQLPNDAVEALLRPHSPAVTPVGQATPASLITDLMEAVRNYDAPAAEREFGRLAASLEPSRLVLEVVLPVLRRIGEEWVAGTLKPGQEHLISHIIRNVLGNLLRVLTSTTQPRTALFATLPGELHELGILSAALLAASSGVAALYLGVNLPVEDIADTATRAGVSLVVVGLTAMSAAEARRQLLALRRLLPDSVDIWVGGSAAPRVRGVHVTTSLEQFHQDLLSSR